MYEAASWPSRTDHGRPVATCASSPAAGRRRRARRLAGVTVVRERGAAYDATAPAPDGAEAARGSGPGLEEALADLVAAVDVLHAVALDEEADVAVGAGALELQRLTSRLQSTLVAALGELDRRGAHEHDGAVTAASWFRERSRVDPVQSQRLVHAGRRLPRLPRLAAALAEGAVTLEHVTAVTSAAVPQRLAAITEYEATLTRLARRAQPRDVRTAVGRIRDVVDPDGSDTPPLEGRGPDPRRHLSLAPGVDGLGQGSMTLDPLTYERLGTLLEAFDTPDGAEVPHDQRRSPGQQRHDALDALLRRALAMADLPSVQGARPHVLAMMDMATLAGADSEAIHTPQLRHAGPISPERARELARDACITAVQTMGPWRPVNVGRRHRTLPVWLREVLQMLHRTCRGPDCDRPVTWTEPQHVIPWAAGGETDLARTVPLCKAHHDLVTTKGWTVTMDPATGVCTWTSPDGRTLFTHPPPA